MSANPERNQRLFDDFIRIRGECFAPLWKEGRAHYSPVGTTGDAVRHGGNLMWIKHDNRPAGGCGIVRINIDTIMIYEPVMLRHPRGHDEAGVLFCSMSGVERSLRFTSESERDSFLAHLDELTSAKHADHLTRFD